MPKKSKQLTEKRSNEPISRAANKPAVYEETPIPRVVTTSNSEETDLVSESDQEAEVLPVLTDAAASVDSGAFQSPQSKSKTPNLVGPPVLDAEDSEELVEDTIESEDIETADSINIVQTAQVRPTAQKMLSKKLGVIALVIAACLIAAGIFWRTHQNSDSQLTAANKRLLAEIAERAVLPKDEAPTITTVVDKNKVNQTFLARAADGDKVVLYFQSGQAVLYRPSTHQIVNMGPLTQPAAKVFIRNGSTKEVPSSISDRLSQAAGYTITSRDYSSKQGYGKTLVIDISGARPDLAKRAAQLVGGEVTTLPAGESRPDADILVIVGANAR